MRQKLAKVEVEKNRALAKAEEQRQQELAKAEEQRQQERIAQAKAMKAMNLSVENISSLTGLPKEEINKL